MSQRRFAPDPFDAVAVVILLVAAVAFVSSRAGS